MQKPSLCLEIITVAMLFSDNPDWLISAWVAAGVQVSDDHIILKKRFTTFWTSAKLYPVQKPLWTSTSL